MAKKNGHRVTEDDAAAIARMFTAIDAIDAAIGNKKRPVRGAIRCPNECGGTLTFVDHGPYKHAARCSTHGCVEWRF